MIKYKGKKYNSYTAVAKAARVSTSALTRRIREGETVAKAVAALLKRQYVYKGHRFPSLNAVAEFANIPYATLRHRVKKLKMPLDEAVTLPVKKLKTGQVSAFGKTYKNLSVAAEAVTTKKPFDYVVLSSAPLMESSAELSNSSRRSMSPETMPPINWRCGSPAKPSRFAVV